VKVEPSGNQPVIKDLVVDMQMFWDKVRAVKPWVQPTGPEPEREYVVPNAAMVDLTGVMNCIMCGACVSDCTVLEVDKNFLGPAALAKAYRVVNDPRDGKAKERLAALSEYGGVWDCTHCYYCVEVCPKNVAPMDRILALRKEAIEAGYTNNNGSRHSNSLAKSVEHSGWLDESRLAVESFGYFNIKALIKMLPTGLRALRAGKMPPLIHHKRPGADHVQRIFQETEEKKS
ncbi:MAG: 4Fe-4S dicluster domain-containing protein, partial [Chloroflexi bacterium]|nr:4Fe-4S dicluster domain-containing protein [Chloroflexota bacterium]